MGLAATEQLAQIAGIERSTTILDAGSGLGGPSRYLASTYGCRVIGADLSPSMVKPAVTRTELVSSWVNKKRVSLFSAHGWIPTASFLTCCGEPTLVQQTKVDLNWLRHNSVLNLPSRSSYCCNQKIVLMRVERRSANSP